MLKIDTKIEPSSLLGGLDHMWELSAAKIRSLHGSWRPEAGSPVITVDGAYTARSWTEWTQGFQFGSPLFQFDATDDEEFLDMGRRATIETMARHLTNTGVHDHGFNNVSTYGNLWRLMNEKRIDENPWERNLYELALEVSGAVQAGRWASSNDGGGYIYSFLGRHSLFVDTIRTLRVLGIAHCLGHRLTEDNDEKVSLLERLVSHASATLKYNIYYGEGRDQDDVPGRTAHESLFDPVTGEYQGPSTQQGHSRYSTWTRGLAWAMLGCAELLEFVEVLDDFGGREALREALLKAARATCSFYIENTPVDGIPYWDTAAPGLAEMGDYLDRPSDPFNDREPIDSSAAAIACQGLMRLGHYLDPAGAEGGRYLRAGLTVLRTLLSEQYLSCDDSHQGLVLHSVYHRPNGWDHVPEDSSIPRGEACMWGDYHMREAALYVKRLAEKLPYYTFFGGIGR